LHQATIFSLFTRGFCWISPFFSLPQVHTIRIKAFCVSLLNKENEDVLFEFDESRPVTESEMNVILQQAREATMNGLVGDWVGKLL
jgi:hypothetical protein